MSTKVKKIFMKNSKQLTFTIFRTWAIVQFGFVGEITVDNTVERNSAFLATFFCVFFGNREANFGHSIFRRILAAILIGRTLPVVAWAAV